MIGAGPLPPIAMAAPAGIDAAFLYINAALLLAAVIGTAFTRPGGSRGTSFLLLAGGALCALNEATVDRLGLCWFPTINAPPILYQAFGVSVPLFMLPVYGWYVGGQAVIAYAWLHRSTSAARLLRLYVLYALINIALEVAGLNRGVYAYYGNQPLRLALFPCWWAIANALMPLALAAFAIRTRAALSGWRRLGLIVAAPPLALAVNAATVSPVWFALNAGGSVRWTTAAAGVALLFGVLMIRVIAHSIRQI